MIRDGALATGVQPAVQGRRFRAALVGALALLSLSLLTLAHQRAAPTAVDGTRAAEAVRPAPALSAGQVGRGPHALSPSRLTSETKRRILDAYGKLPLSFVPNRGQTDESIRYYARGQGFGFYFTERKAVFAFTKEGRKVALELRFVGANPDVTLEARRRGAGEINYLSRSERRTGLPTHREVVYRELWPGVDMVFRGEGGRLKYEFLLRPGADPSDIRLAYAGASGLSLSEGGGLLVQAPLGRLRDQPPRSYQRIADRRVAVESRFSLQGKRAYGFALGRYERHRPLVIDPALDYSTYLGGSAFDQGAGIALDAAGNAYVSGFTFSSDFPTTAGAHDTSLGGGEDAFITKLDASGSALAYSTYLGGTGDDGALGIAVDAAGNAYVTGFTSSADFPTTPGAADRALGGIADAFVTKLDASGSALAYSTYLGGGGDDRGNGIAVDGAGSAYVTGYTTSADFPTTAGAHDPTLGGCCDAFITKLDATGTALAYSTYLGARSFDAGGGIAVDASGNAYVTGYTFSSDFPTSASAPDTTLGGGEDAFVTKLDASGTALVYSTFLGGSLADGGHAIAVDAAGSAYATGYAYSPDFPTTPGAPGTTVGGISDAFITKLDASGAALAYSTYLGGGRADAGFGIAVDATGSAYVTGFTTSADFPTTADAPDAALGGCCDPFAAKLDASGAGLAYSTYLGGGGDDEAGNGIAVDAAGSAYVTGYTFSSDFPTTAGAYDTSAGGSGDGFIVKLLSSAPRPPLGHFKLYEIGKGKPKFHKRTVTLEDRFGRSEVRVFKPLWLLGPVDKNREGISRPEAHLKCYRITDKRKPGQREVQVDNQFGRQTLILGAPASLCLPASRGPANGNPGTPPAHLDHFKCYEVEDRRPEIGRSVTLEDPFGRDEVVVEEPEYLCTPADKNGEGVEHPDDQLVCYGLGRLDRFTRRNLSLGDQFITQMVALKRAAGLCVPSTLN